MPTIALDDSPYLGNTSRPGTAIFIDHSCLACGSSLAKRRVRSAQRRVIGGVTYSVDTYRCGCGRRREVKRAM